MSRHEVEKRLRSGRPAPPVELMERIQRDIPTDLFPQTRPEPAKRRWRLVIPRVSLLRANWAPVAASLALITLAGIVALRMSDLRSRPTVVADAAAGAPAEAERAIAAKDDEAPSSEPTAAGRVAEQDAQAPLPEAPSPAVPARGDLRDQRQRMAVTGETAKEEPALDAVRPVVETPATASDLDTAEAELERSEVAEPKKQMELERRATPAVEERLEQARAELPDRVPARASAAAKRRVANDQVASADRAAEPAAPRERSQATRFAQEERTRELRAGVAAQTPNPWLEAPRLTRVDRGLRLRGRLAAGYVGLRVGAASTTHEAGAERETSGAAADRSAETPEQLPVGADGRLDVVLSELPGAPGELRLELLDRQGNVVEWLVEVPERR